MYLDYFWTFQKFKIFTIFSKLNWNNFSVSSQVLLWLNISQLFLIYFHNEKLYYLFKLSTILWSIFHFHLYSFQISSTNYSILFFFYSLISILSNSNSFLNFTVFSNLFLYFFILFSIFPLSVFILSSYSSKTIPISINNLTFAVTIFYFHIFLANRYNFYHLQNSK